MCTSWVSGAPKAAEVSEIKIALLHDCYKNGGAGGLSTTGTAADLVGVAGFEPTAPRSQSECATKLRHTPCTAA